MGVSTGGTCTSPVVCRTHRKAWVLASFAGVTARHLGYLSDLRRDLLRAPRSVRAKLRRAWWTAEQRYRFLRQAWRRCCCCRRFRSPLPSCSRPMDGTPGIKQQYFALPGARRFDVEWRLHRPGANQKLRWVSSAASGVDFSSQRSFCDITRRSPGRLLQVIRQCGSWMRLAVVRCDGFIQ
jgi:hypothetical protein